MKKIILITALINATMLLSNGSEWLANFKKAAPIGAESYTYWSVLGAGAVCAYGMAMLIAEGDVCGAVDLIPLNLKYMAFSAAAGATLGTAVAAVNPKRLIKRDKDPESSISRSLFAQFAVATWGTTALTALVHKKSTGG